MYNAQDNVLGQTDEVPADMEIVSSVLEPIIITPTHARWVLKPEGILSRDSCIQFQLTVPAALDKKGFLPVGAGIWGLIRSATLSVGGKRVNHTEGLGYWKSITSAYDTPSYRTNKKRILTGEQTVLQPCAIAPTASWSAAAGMYEFASSNVIREHTAAQGGIVDLDYQNQLRSTSELTPCWTIKLADLFNLLYDVELPLFLLNTNQEVAIDLHFNTQAGGDTSAGNGTGTLCCFEALAAGPPPNGQQVGACNLVLDSCLLYQDTIYYSDERRELEAEKVNASKGLYTSYSDVISNVASHPVAPSVAAALPTSHMTILQKTDLIPLSGFRAKNLFWAETVADWTSNPGGHTPIVPATYVNYNSLLGVYALVAYHDNPTVDLRVNDVLSFPTPLTSQSVKAAEAENCYGSPVWLSQALWSYNPITNKVANAAAVPPITGDHPVQPLAKLLPSNDQYPIWGGGARGFMSLDALQGNLSFNGINLSHGWGNDNDDFVLVGAKPLEVIHSSLPVNQISNYNRTCRYYSEVVKGFGILGGKVDIQQGPPVLI